jgi:hypothetical protein
MLPLSATYQHSLLHNATLLDLLITNNKNRVNNFCQIPKNAISKHHLIFLSYDIRIPKKHANFATYGSYKAININDLMQDASALPRSDVNLCDSVDSKVHFENNFMYLFIG